MGWRAAELLEECTQILFYFPPTACISSVMSETEYLLLDVLSIVLHFSVTCPSVPLGHFAVTCPSVPLGQCYTGLSFLLQIFFSQFVVFLLA